LAAHPEIIPDNGTGSVRFGPQHWAGPGRSMRKHGNRFAVCLAGKDESDSPNRL